MSHAAVDLLGVRVDALSLEETLAWIDRRVTAKVGGFLNTLNMSLLLNVDRHPGMHEIFAACDLNVADGVPLQWLARLAGGRLRGRVNGTDLMNALCRRSAERGHRLFLLGAGADVLERAAANLAAKHPGCRIAGTHSPPFRPVWSEEENDGIVRRIAESGAQIVLVAFGFPKQEYWIAAHRARLPACLFVNVGGSFDVAAGAVKRAPTWMQRSGLEWLFRAAQEPWRLGPRYARDLLVVVPRVVAWWGGAR